ncbi:MAG: methylmalonyl-CoA epimerase [Chloroflexi bacterium]|jgi:methylmalonyl-CoA/ethylmalonyl-CoA epimerase|nr:methylmalonyl-CoA epimerase [Chloroflexota bacterium]
MITRIDHVAIVLPELTEGTSFWVDALGLPLEKIEEVPEQQVHIAMLPVGGAYIELLAPSEETSGVARYLQKKGPGLHHICLEVDDIEALLARLKQANIPLIDEVPRIGSDGKKLAFIHPKGSGGVLVELYQYPKSEYKKDPEFAPDK